MAAVLLIMTVILIVACFLYRQTIHIWKVRYIDRLQNGVHEGDIQPERELPQIPDELDSDYEQPAEYAELANSLRLPIVENYQSLIVEGYEELHRNYSENLVQ